MEFILMFIIIYVLSITISTILKKKIDFVIPITLVGMVLLVYIFGVFEQLTMGMIALEIVAAASGVFVIYQIIKNIKNKTLKEFLKNIVTPGVLICILLLIINVYLNRNRLLELYDNFNHWVLIVKNMFLYDGYGTVENSVISFNEYPPFTATFQYMLLNLKGIYSEDTIIMAQNMLYFSMIMPLFHKVEWKQGKRRLFYLLPVVVLLPLVFYRNFYTDILVDGFIGILFALGLYEIFRNDKSKIYKYAILGSYALALALTKNTGILFAALLILLEGINLIIDKVNAKKNIKKDILGIGIIILTLVVFAGGWYLIINLQESEQMWDQTQEEQMNEEYKQTVIQSFVHELYTGSQEITVQNLSTLVLFVMYITYSVCIYQKNKDKLEDKHRLRNIFIIMPIAMVIYVLGMLYSYLYLFRPDETLILSSFNRYISSMLLAGFFLNTIILGEIINWKNYYICIVLMFILIFVPFEDIKDRYVEFNKYNISVMAKRNEYGKINKYKNLLKENDVIYYVSNKFDNLYAVALSKYEMMPIQIISNDEISEGKFEDIIRDIATYVYVLNEDLSFENRFKNVFDSNFECEEDSLYKIIKDGENIELQKVN